MNSRKKVLRTVLFPLLATVLLYSAFPAQVDSVMTLGGRTTLEPSQVEAPNYIGKTTELFASWPGIEPESGIDHYEFSVGSSPGDTGVLPWTRTNRDSVYLGGLNLANGARYFFNVRAFNSAGIGSPTVYSPGTTVDTNLPDFPLYFPSVVAFPGTFTGLALANTGITPAQVIFKLYDNDGNLNLDAGLRNPRVRMLNSREQISVLSTELFSSPSGNTPGWVRVESTSPDVQGFYLYGANNLAFLDGTEVSTKTLTDFVFHRIEELGQDVYTSLNIVNPGDTDATVTLDLRDTGGQLISSQNVTIRARRRLVKSITGLFPSAGQVRGGTVRVRSNAGLVGFELFTSNAVDVGGMSPQPTTSAASQVVFAQLASVTGWYTKISLTNPNTNPVTVELIARIGEEGLGRPPITVSIPPWGQYNGEVVSAFGFPPGSQLTGYITARVVNGSGGIFGHVVFGTTGGAIAALPIQTQGSKGMVFSQVAQDNTYFTGLTLVNPSSTAVANVLVEVFDPSGGVLGSSEQIGSRWGSFQPGERRAKLIHEIVPGVLGRSAGYFVVTSDQPIVGFELFGGVNAGGQIPFLAAVPPQPIAANPAMAAAVPARSESRPLRPNIDPGSLYLKLYDASRQKVK
jgi:hypothetical protein